FQPYQAAPTSATNAAHTNNAFRSPDFCALAPPALSALPASALPSRLNAAGAALTASPPETGGSISNAVEEAHMEVVPGQRTFRKLYILQNSACLDTVNRMTGIIEKHGSQRIRY